MASEIPASPAVTTTPVVPIAAASPVAPKAAVITVAAPTSAAAPPETDTGAQFHQISEDLSQIVELIVAAHEQQNARDKAFDLLYKELGDYKNDFFYERLKPVLRALLFMLDSMEQFGREVDQLEGMGEHMSHEMIKANLEHFSDQFIDAMQMVEMMPIELGAEFDAKTQRAIEAVPVEADQNGRVQRVIRRGWTLGGKMLRPADVVVGKSR
jgi:molecular chaperone GrpE (heat shock protein)